MKKVDVATLATIVVTALAVLASFFIPVPQGSNPSDFYFDLAFTVPTPFFSFGASIIILIGFGAFTSQFRRAYTIIFIGLSVWGIGYLQLPLLVIINQLHNSVFLSASVVPFIGSVMLIFTGTRMLVKLFNVKTIATSWWFAFAVIVVVSILVIIVPHKDITSDELSYDLTHVLIMAACTFFALCAYHILLIKRQASVAYTNAFAWLCLSMFITAFMGGYASTFLVILLGEDVARLTNSIALVSSCIGAALFLRSAYSFNTIVESADVQSLSVARNFFGKPLQPRQSTQISPIDIITYTVNLVSNPSNIEPIVDKLREFTTYLKPGQGLTVADNALLKNIYLEIERYLLEKEPVRKFSKDSLRQTIANRLQLSTNSSVGFWRELQ